MKVDKTGDKYTIFCKLYERQIKWEIVIQYFVN